MSEKDRRKQGNMDKNKLKSLILIGFVLIALVAIPVVCILADTGDPDGEDGLRLANTEGMHFGFDQEDVTVLTTGAAPVVITFPDDATETTASSETEAQNGTAQTEPSDSAPNQTGTPEITDTEPKETEPEGTGATETEPTETEPEETGNAETEPKETDPAETEPKQTEPKQTEPKETEPPVTEPAPTQPEPEDGVLTISSGGAYTFSGTKRDTMLLIDVGDADVILILDGLTLRNSTGPAIYVRSAGKVTVTLAAGSVNTLSDGSSYSIVDGDSALDAALFSRADLVINGSGTLNITGNYKHGIVSKDDLIISSGTVSVSAQNVGLNGKDCVKINSGDITIRAGTDGIRSDNTEDASKGYIYLYGGVVDITAGNDGIQAETVLKIEDVDLAVTSGGGSSATSGTTEESYKGLKAGSDIYISGGEFVIDSKDDSIHSNGTVTISGGTYTLSSGDDGVHADTDLAISGSATTLTVTKSYEGIEASNLVFSGGKISIKATDDGINAAGGNDSSSGTPQRPGDSFTSSTGSILISGGSIYINAAGDGLDANGTLSITGGDLVLSGPNNGDTAILDYDTTGAISGGTFIGTGASGMTQNFGNTSTQGAILYKTGTCASGTKITLKDSSGNVLLSRTADQSFSCVILSHPSIAVGKTYTLTVGSSSYQITMTSLVYSSGGSGRPGGK